MIEQLKSLARPPDGAKLRPLLRTFIAQSESFNQVRTPVRDILKRVTYQRSSGEVLIQLRGPKEKRNA